MEELGPRNNLMQRSWCKMSGRDGGGEGEDVVARDLFVRKKLTPFYLQGEIVFP